MGKLFLIVLIFGLFIAAVPASAKISESNFLAAIGKLVQEIMPKEEIFSEPEIMEFNEDFVDPREVQQVLREIKDMRRELNRFAKQLVKMANSGDDSNQVNSLLGQIKDFESKILAEESLRDTIQEFRDAQIWQELQKIRAKIEIPKEMKQWDKEIKRGEKLLKQKKIQTLGSDLGLDLVNASAKLEEIKAGLAIVQELYNGNDLEGAMEEFNDIRQDFYPGEITSLLQRLQELTSRLKIIKDGAIKTQIKETLAEVISNFNDGEYRVAQQLLDENFNALTQLIMKAASVGKKKGQTRDSWFRAMETVETKMKESGEVKKEQLQDMRTKIEQPPVEQQSPVIQIPPTKEEIVPAPVQ